MKKNLFPKVRTLSLLPFFIYPLLSFASESTTEHSGTRTKNFTFLPNWFEPLLEKQNQSIVRPTNPDALPEHFRVPAEYEPIQAVVMGWTEPTNILSEIAKTVSAQTKANIWMAQSPASIPGVPAKRLLATDCPVDTIWARDYGPVGLSMETKTIGLIDATYRHYQSRPDDDALPKCLAQKVKAPSYQVNLILDGGNFLIDSKGTLFTTYRTQIWNNDKTSEAVTEILKKSYGVKSIQWLEYAGYPDDPSDGTGHIDMFVKLLSDDTVLISEANTEPFKTNVQKAADLFAKLKTPNGKSYNILRVPGFSQQGTWYTYTNSLVVNGVALIPSYHDYPKQNTLAQKAYEQAGYKVVQIPSDETIGSGGSIHCVTQTVPAVDSATIQDE